MLSDGSKAVSQAYAGVEMRVDPAGRLAADAGRRLEIREPRLLDAARRPEVVEQRALSSSADAGDLVEFARGKRARPAGR